MAPVRPEDVACPFSPQIEIYPRSYLLPSGFSPRGKKLQRTTMVFIIKFQNDIGESRMSFPQQQETWSATTTGALSALNVHHSAKHGEIVTLRASPTAVRTRAHQVIAFRWKSDHQNFGDLFLLFYHYPHPVYYPPWWFSGSHFLLIDSARIPQQPLSFIIRSIINLITLFASFLANKVIFPLSAHLEQNREARIIINSPHPLFFLLISLFLSFL